MSAQRLSVPPTEAAATPTVPTPRAPVPTPVPASVPHRDVRRVVPAPRPTGRPTARRIVVAVLDMVLGETLAQRPRAGLGVLALLAALLVIIAVTLSVGNALLVLLAMVGMRLACEWRRP